MKMKHLVAQLIKYDPEDEVYVSNINTTSIEDANDLIIQVTKEDEDMIIRLEYNGPALEADNLE
jgi:hypothetical protein